MDYPVEVDLFNWLFPPNWTHLTTPLLALGRFQWTYGPVGIRVQSPAWLCVGCACLGQVPWLPRDSFFSYKLRRVIPCSSLGCRWMAGYTAALMYSMVSRFTKWTTLNLSCGLSSASSGHHNGCTTLLNQPSRSLLYWGVSLNSLTHPLC